METSIQSQPYKENTAPEMIAHKMQEILKRMASVSQIAAVAVPFKTAPKIASLLSRELKA